MAIRAPDGANKNEIENTYRLVCGVHGHNVRCKITNDPSGVSCKFISERGMPWHFHKPSLIDKYFHTLELHAKKLKE